MPSRNDNTHVPSGVRLVQDFVNSREPQVDADLFSSPDALREWCVARELVPAGARMDLADVEQAVAVREGLRAVLTAHAGHEEEPALVQRLNEVLEQFPVGLRFDSGRYQLTALTDRPIAQAFAAIADAVRQASEDQTWPRLKVCARDSCRWAFYDASRNQARRWCSMAGCGNHVKMKRAYARRTQGTAELRP